MIPREFIAEHNETVGARLTADVAHATRGVGCRRRRRRAVIAEVAAFLGRGALVGGRYRRHPVRSVPDRRRAARHRREGRRRRRAQRPDRRQPHDQPPRAVGRPDDPEGLRAYAAERGIGFDAMNSNTFQDNPSTTEDGRVSYKFGSLANVDDGVRKAAVEHNLAVIDLGVQLGSKAITVWLADGMNHPGQASFRGQFERVADGLRDIHDQLPADWLMFTEHKPFEPAFYSSVNNDWGSSLLLAQGAGERCKCLVDLGHHLPNTNIEQVVCRLAMAGRLGGFHFNDSKYGDDDLTVGSIKPFQLFLIFLELLEVGGGRMPDLAYMIDESHNLKDPLEDLIQATDAIQHTLALALCVRATNWSTRSTATTRPGPPRSCIAPTAPTCGRSWPRRAAATVPRSSRSPRTGRSGYRARQARRARRVSVRHRPVGPLLRVAAVDLGATSARVAVVDLDDASRRRWRWSTATRIDLSQQ